MTLAVVYWVIMLIWLVFGVWSNWQSPAVTRLGGDAVLFVLLVIVGWKVFGPPIHG